MNKTTRKNKTPTNEALLPGGANVPEAPEEQERFFF